MCVDIATDLLWHGRRMRVKHFISSEPQIQGSRVIGKKIVLGGQELLTDVASLNFDDIAETTLLVRIFALFLTVPGPTMA